MTMHTSPTIERLLADAYDAEQAGQPLEAAQLRTEARDLAAQFNQLTPAARAFCEKVEAVVEALPADQQSTAYGMITGTIEDLQRRDAEIAALSERRRMIFRLFDEALGLDDEKYYDAELECTVWDRDDTRIYFDHRQQRITTVSALGAVLDIHTPDDLADLHDLVALLDRPDVRAAIGVQPVCTPVVRVERMRGDGNVLYTSLVAGDGLTMAHIGEGCGDKSGLELIIGGNMINAMLSEVITLDDVRQLRDNLSALLNDPRSATLARPSKAHSPLFQDLKSWVDTKLAEDDAAEDRVAIATVRAQLDRFTATPAERRYLLDLIDSAERSGDCPMFLVDLANAIQRPPRYLGFQVSPGALPTTYTSANQSSNPPRLTFVNGALYARCGGDPNPSDLEAVIEDRVNEQPQRVIEITRLPHRGLVVLDCLEDTFILTEAEYSAQIG